MGFGAMRITGKGIWGEPEDAAEAARVLGRVPELGIDLIDTANSYGPNVSERLIREVLHPYKGLIVATKGGLERPGPNQWTPKGQPAYLRQCVTDSLERLGLSRIDLWQLHRIDPAVPAAEQFAVIREMQEEGLIRHAGLSQVSVADIEAASHYFKVATVQNLFNIADRTSEDVLDFCAANGIGFIPWFPLGAGGLAKPSPVIEDVAKIHGATPSQISLAWLLRRSPVMLPIPGTSRVAHLEENAGAAAIKLSGDDFDALTKGVRARTRTA
jgi:aryl-alcohol dehydrogenase-like predicted oxidoreductase